MRIKTFALLLGLALCLPAQPSFAQGSLGGLIQTVVQPILSVSTPFGTVGSLSLATLDQIPGLSSLSLPVIGSFSGVPVLGTVTVSKGITLVESLAPFVTTLPGLPI